MAADISQPQLAHDSSRDSFHNSNNSQNKMFVGFGFFFPKTWSSVGSLSNKTFIA